MNAAELRGALEARSHGESCSVLEDAARTIALPILEADPELVERVAEVLWRADQGDWYRLEGHADKNARDLLEVSRYILAAISTPTAVESE